MALATAAFTFVIRGEALGDASELIARRILVDRPK